MAWISLSVLFETLLPRKSSPVIDLKESVMPKYRNKLPQLESRLFLTDGGLLTTLIYKRKIEVPYLATFLLLDDPRGREELRLFACEYIDIAR